MQFSALFTLVLVWLQILVSLAAPAVGVDRHEDEVVAILQPRQQQPTTTTISTLSSTTSTTSTSSTSTTNIAATITTTTGKSAPKTDTAISKPTTTVPWLNPATTSTSRKGQYGNTSTYEGGLPIQPEITPALGVAGVILLLLGGTLCLIGVRKPWVHIFLSTAFIMALGVTVLIVYVMSPPVSDAVQGGYLVAVVSTALVFGGLALVFREITEGLGCLLGGFCIAMWLLTLTSGGLITNNGPKVGLIVSFMVAFYCLSFTRYTRSYGLIVCTAFSGATALVLGIDCLSRAGLKEFWLYIWDLNKREFPLHTDTYPVTRYLRVEQAVIMIVTAMGVIAQLRLWKVVKERRTKEENVRKEEEKKKDAEEHEVGRRVEQNNNRERAEWEHMYGTRHDGKLPSESETAVGEDSRRGSGVSCREKADHEDSIEMKDMNTTDPSAEPSDWERNRDLGDDETPDTSVGDGSGWPDNQDKVEQKTSEPVTTAIMPHFETMVCAQTGVHDDDNDDDSEHGAVVGSDAGTFRSKRISTKPLLSRLSWRSNHSARRVSQKQSEEALVGEEDSNSSVAGVIDELGETSSACPSITSETQDEASEGNGQQIRISLDDEEDNTDVISKGHADYSDEGADAAPDANTVKSNQAKVRVEEVILAGMPLEQTTTLPTKEHEAGVAESLRADVVDAHSREEAKRNHDEELTRREAEGSISEGLQEPHAGREVENNIVSASRSTISKQDEKLRLDTPTVKCIPEQTSKIVHSYRTQEWTKHLEHAELPEVEPIQAVNTQSPEQWTEARERAAPVEVEQLLQTPLNAQPAPVITRSVSAGKVVLSPERTRRTSKISPTPTHETPRSKSRSCVRSMAMPQSLRALSREPSEASLNMPRSTSLPFAPEQRQSAVNPTRSTSTPFVTVTGPGDGNGMKSTRRSEPPPLLAVRESMVRNRLSSTSLRYEPRASRSSSRMTLAEPFASPTFSIPEEREEEGSGFAHDDDEDLPLSKRRDMLQRQTMNSPSAGSLQSIEPARSPASGRAVDAVRSAAIMAAWRQSVREDISQRRDPLALNSPSLALGPSTDRPLNMWSSMHQMREASTTHLDSAVTDGMQRGSMTDLHRQAMRRMQASVNRQL